jgi:hypothetical protein
MADKFSFGCICEATKKGALAVKPLRPSLTEPKSFYAFQSNLT